MCSCAVSSHETLVSDGFLASDATCDPCKWTNMMSETGIEPSCVGIGQKLTSVDQKTSTTMVMAFPILRLTILRIFVKPIHGYVCLYVVEISVKRSVGQTVRQIHLFRPLYHLIT